MAAGARRMFHAEPFALDCRSGADRPANPHEQGARRFYAASWRTPTLGTFARTASHSRRKSVVASDSLRPLEPVPKWARHRSAELGNVDASRFDRRGSRPVGNTGAN